MRSIALIAGVIVVLTSCAAPAPSAPDPAVERAAVEQAITQWYDSGVAVGDTAVLKRGLTPTFAILLDTVWYDKAGLIKYVSSLPSLLGGPFTWRYTFSDWRTQVHGDVAWTTFRDRAVLTPQNGAPVPYDWWETVVLRKVDGAWLMDRYQSAPVRR
jgi:hypothetical protein